MSGPNRPPAAERYVRILRLIAALSVALALVAVASIAKGGLTTGGQRFIIVAIALGACALVGMSMVVLPYALRQKDKNDPRP